MFPFPFWQRFGCRFLRFGWAPVPCQVEYAELCIGKQMFVDMNKKRLRLVFLCGAALLIVSCREGAPTTAQQAYPVAKVACESVETTADYPATIRGRQDVQIYPQVEGKLTARPVR